MGRVGRWGALAGSAAIAVVIAGGSLAAGASGNGFAPAYYSNYPAQLQAKSPAGMRSYLSNDQTQMEMQSQIIFGNLQTPNGKFNSFAAMVQRQDGLIPQVPSLPISLSTVMMNTGQGIFGGVINGIPELTFPMSLTSNPWSARAETVSAGQKPNFIDMRVVEGQLGRPGSIYEVTADIPSESIGSGGAPAEPLTVYLRVKDPLGIAMWGFGPSGFKPQWLTAGQRSAIDDRFGGSIRDYLKATNDPMTNQGNYYYSSPLLKVQKFVVYRNNALILKGDGGYMFFDQCTQSFDANSEQIVNNGFNWISFETPIPALGGGMAIGKMSQPTVGSLPYAALVTPKSPKAKNGARVAYNWGIDDISLNPVEGSEWTSPSSGKTYFMEWRLRLRGPKPSRRGTLTLTAVTKNSEVNFAGRAVYEGLFRYRGTIAGKKVSGSSFAEMQPEGSL